MTQAPQLRSRIVGHDDVDPATLIAHPLNYRSHPKEQADALDAVLEGIGWVGSCTVNRRTGLLVDGHLRVQRAIAHGEATVPVTYVDLSPEEERLVLATLDPIAALAGADADLTARLFAEGMGAGAEDERLAALLASLRADEPKIGLTDPDEVPPLPEEPVSKRGDLWILGEHRLLCGDATSSDDVTRLLAGDKPNLMVTDPPYGVNYDPSWRKGLGPKSGGARMGLVPNDDRADWTPAWKLSPADVAYVWHGARFASIVQTSLEAAGLDIRSQIIWSKTRFVISRGHYHWRHEACWYAVRKGQTASWLGDRKQSTIWHAGEEPSLEDLLAVYQAVQEFSTVWEVTLDANVEGGHSTQKPVEVMERSIRNHGGDVYDPFVGSGTTCIAAERQGRRCYAMELSPAYCDVVVARFQNYTGKMAILEGASS